MKEILAYITCFIFDSGVFFLGYVVGKKAKNDMESIKK